MSLTCKRAIVNGGSVVLVGIFFKTNVTHSWALAGPDSIIWTFVGFAIHLLSVSCYRVSWQILQLCYCFFLCESMNFHPDKQLLKLPAPGSNHWDATGTHLVNFISLPWKLNHPYYHGSQFSHWNQALLLFLYPMGRIIPQSESEPSDIFIIATTYSILSCVPDYKDNKYKFEKAKKNLSTHSSIQCNRVLHQKI